MDDSIVSRIQGGSPTNVSRCTLPPSMPKDARM
jgi:hypothetical protein